MWTPEAQLLVADDARPLVRLGVIHALRVAIRPSEEALLSEIDTTSADLISAHAGSPPGSIPGLTAARELYRSFGMDPTRTRPSSEALLRRVLQGKGLPRILNAVDLCNLCALRYLLPIGLYDAARVTPPVTLRRGRTGEDYAGIRKEMVPLEGRPLLSDAIGPFGNPTSDSLRASVTETTGSLVMVIFAPAATPESRLMEHVADASATLARHLAVPGAAWSASTRVVPA